MSNVVTCHEPARRYLRPEAVEVGDLYTVHALGTAAAGYMRRFPQQSHTVSLPCGGHSVAHITLRPEDNGTGFYSYARVVAVEHEGAEQPEVEDSTPDFAAL